LRGRAANSFEGLDHDRHPAAERTLDQDDVTRAERMPSLYNEHRAFGIGQHFCLGSHLARLELNIMFNEILPRLRNPRFAEEPKFVRSYFVNAMKEMRITFDKAA